MSHRLGRLSFRRHGWAHFERPGHPGLTQLGEFEPVFIERIGRLQLFRPPVENLIAAKLIRAEPKDLDDIKFLVSRHRPDLNGVRQIVARFNPHARERATENLVYLDVLET